MKLNRALLGTPNFIKLVQIVGDRQKALGMLAEVHILAKDYFLPDKRPIPQAELMEAELPIEKLVKLKFLEKEVEGYYMTESEMVFEYYFSNKEQRRKAGKASAESPNHHALRGPDGRFIPKEKLAQMSQAEISELKRQNAARKKAKNVKNSEKLRKKAKKVKKGSVEKSRKNVDKSVNKKKAGRRKAKRTRQSESSPA